MEQIPWATLDLENGFRVEFSQDKYNNITISEQGAFGVNPIMMDPRFENKSPLKIHGILRPDVRIPEKLLEAVKRDEAAPQAVAPNTGSPGIQKEEVFGGVNSSDMEQNPNAPLGKAALTSSQFENNYCDTRRIFHWYRPPYYWETTECYIRKTNNVQKTMYNIREGYGIVYVYRGTVSFKRSARASGNSDWATSAWSVPEGTWKWANYASGSGDVDYDVRYNISNADGDGWHFASQMGDEFNCRPGCFYNGEVCLCSQ